MSSIKWLQTKFKNKNDFWALDNEWCMIMLYDFQISSMIEIEVELELDVVAAEAVNNVVYAL